ncbi:MAG: signal peptide peptidase SppA [Methanomicrobiales archaeon]|nr:signal peptide peptidase SppA [Methanomicrobiales archaeon]
MTFLEEYIRKIEWRQQHRKILLVSSIALLILCSLAVLFFYISMPMERRVAVITIEGQIYTGDYMDETLTGSVAIGRKIRSAADDPFVEAIVLRVNSPGGTPAAAQEIIGDIKYARERKPVVVSMGDIATSGAYYISAFANRIYADPDTITGGIGTLWIFTDASAWMEKEGYNVTVIKSGDKKDMTYPYRNLTDEEKQLAQEIVNRSADRFISDIVAERGIAREVVEDGRLIRGEEAMNMGLVDELGNLQDATTGAITLAREFRP